MTNIELAEKISGYLKGSKAKAKKFKQLVAIHFNLLDISQDMYIEIKDGAIAVMPYEYNDRTAAVTVSTETLEKIMSGDITIDAAIADGLVQVEGDVDSFKALAALIPANGAAEKAPAKKAAEKKAPAKAAAKPAAKKACAKKPAAKAEEKTEAPKAEEKKAEVKPVPAKAEAKPAAKKTTAKKSAK